jgi:hypothetical protein
MRGHFRTALEADGEQQIEREALGHRLGEAEIRAGERRGKAQHERQDDGREKVLARERKDTRHRHAQGRHGEFDGGRGRVMPTVRPQRRNQRRDRAVDEDLVGVPAEHGGHMHPAVAAGNDHLARALSHFGKTAIPGLVLAMRRCLPAVKTLREVDRQRADSVHRQGVAPLFLNIEGFRRISAIIAVATNPFLSISGKTRVCGSSDGW